MSFKTCLSVPSIRCVQDFTEQRPHAEYEFCVTHHNLAFSTHRRYRDVQRFASAHARKPKLKGFFNHPPALPPTSHSPWKQFNNADLEPAFLESRRAAIETYFQEMLPLATAEVLSFLQPMAGDTHAPAADEQLATKEGGLEARSKPGSSSPDVSTTPLHGRAVSRLQSGWRTRLRFSPSSIGEFGTPPAHTPPQPAGTPAFELPVWGAKSRVANQAALLIARTIKGFAMRRRFQRALERRRASAACILQAAMRGRHTRAVVRSASQVWLDCAASHLQRCVRAFLVRRDFVRRLFWRECAAVHLQRVARGGRARGQTRRRIASLGRIQVTLRGAVTRRRVRDAQALWFDSAAGHLQSAVRRHLSRRRYERLSRSRSPPPAVRPPCVRSAADHEPEPELAHALRRPSDSERPDGQLVAQGDNARPLSDARTAHVAAFAEGILPLMRADQELAAAAVRAGEREPVTLALNNTKALLQLMRAMV